MSDRSSRYTWEDDDTEIISQPPADDELRAALESAANDEKPSDDNTDDNTADDSTDEDEA